MAEMSASICSRCSGYIAAENEDHDWVCINCGFVVYRTEPLPLVKTVAGSAGPSHDRLAGVKPALKGPGSLAR
jgi:ribosomal protein S27AE